MKKILLLASMLLIAVGALAQTPPFRPVVSSFINNGTFLILTNNTTYNPASSSNVWFYSYAAGTNIQAGMPVTNYLTSALAVTDVPIWCDANGLANANISILLTLGNTNANLPANYSPRSTPVPAIGITADSTNTVTVTLLPVAANGEASTGTFVFSLKDTGVAPVTLLTNVPSSFLLGAAKLRISTLVTDNKASSTIISTLAVSGWER